MNVSFWRGCRVFLTGHTGFKGSWLSLWLQSLGAQVTGYALAPVTPYNLFEIAGVAKGMHLSIEADIRDLGSLTRALQAASPDIVIHMAAQPLVRLSYQQPVDTFATNVMGTVHLFEAVRATPGVRAVVNVTTDKCYENREWVWGYRERDPMGGYDPYSSSKGCAELVTAAYRTSYFAPVRQGENGVAVATARAGNVIGGGDWAVDRLIPDILAAFANDRPANIRNPDAVRPWQHVLEPLRGYLMLAQRLALDGPGFAESWNFGPLDEDARPVRWVVQQMARRWGDGAHWTVDDRKHPYEAHFLKLDISKARSRLHWQPALRLADALDLTIDWAHHHKAGADMRDVTLRQIAAYQSLVDLPSIQAA